MTACKSCGKENLEGVRFCADCGTALEEAPLEQNAPDPGAAADFDPKDIAENKFMAILSYFGPLVLIPWFAAPGSKYARYHAGQGVTLLILYVAYWIVSFLLGMIKTTHYLWGVPYPATPWYISLVSWLIGVPLFVLSIIGIINAAQGRAKELPIVGKFRFIK